MSSDFFSKSLFSFQKQFFSRVNLKDINWKEVLQPCYDEATGLVYQEQLLGSTFAHATNKTFPLRQQYQISVLKQIIKALEANFCEVHSGFYEELCRLLSQSDSTDSYLHFFKEDPQVPYVSINENVAVISKGTTGLSTWPAARVLAEFCVCNPSLFEGKNILELGCGTGLLGLSILKSSTPKNYVFSDCNVDVLRLVEKNVSLNYPDGNSRVKIEKLLWENIADDTFADSNPDVIVGADIIYDASAVIPLVSVLKRFVTFKSNGDILIACAVRNEETFAVFAKTVSDWGGGLVDLSVNTFDTFYPNADVPLKVFQVRF